MSYNCINIDIPFVARQRADVGSDDVPCRGVPITC